MRSTSLRKSALFGLAAACAASAYAAEPMSTAEIVVDCSTVVGPVKPMHAVNNGPNVTKPGGDQKRGNFSEYRAARIPFARTHDANFSSSYGGELVKCVVVE